jgi:hypothetical protein
MKSWTPPTAEELDRVAALSARSENRAYFFERLDNPEWVAPLSERGFFENPPPPIAAPEPGYVRFPPWPEGRYLARMASSAPEDVAGVLITMGSSENPTVTRLLLEAVASLPESKAAGLAGQVRVWIAGPHADFYADDAATVALHLVNAGEVRSAIEIVSSLLQVLPDPRLSEKRVSTEKAFRLTPEASSRLSDWEYKRVVDQVLEPLVDAGGLDAVRKFSALLDDALRLSRWEDEVRDETKGDYSYIWRPAIEDHSQNSETGVKSILVIAVRDAALRYASGGASEVDAVINDLEQGSTTHTRIALHVLANTDHGGELASDRIADRDLFDDHRIRHEYANLLRSRFKHVGEDAQNRVIEWIESGPDVDWYRERRIERDGTEPSEDDVRRYADLWRRDRYSYIVDSLGGSTADRYRDLVQAYGEPEHPDFTSWSASWVGPESPVEQEELLQMSPPEVADLLRRWRPDDDSEGHFGPSIEGLGRIFSGVVVARPADYAAEAGRLVDVDPTYVRELFSGLEQALAKGEAFSWEEPLRLASWVSQQPFEPDDDVSYRDRDPGWRWCRRQIASLLRSGLSAKENGILPELRELVWEVIARLIDDPNPSPEHEARYGGDNMDPLTLSLNTNRGEAMHAAIEYALWVHRDIEARGGDVSSGFELIPEVRTLLERHLDLSVEPSHAVRAVYGRWLPWLVLLDDAWTAASLRVIFPAAPEAIAYADTAWSTYVTWCPPYDSAFRVLRPQYEDAVQRVPSGRKAGSSQRASVDAKLGEHLVTFFWRGPVDRDLLERFFERADDELAAAVLAFVGRVLRNTPGDLSPPILRRMEELFEWRLAVGESAPEHHQLELRSFGIWFSSGTLEETWALETLRKTVDLAGAPTLGHLVVERLVDVARRNPVAAVDLLAGMLARPENEWDDVGWRDPVEKVLSIARDSGVPEAVQSMREIVDHYVRRGRNEFRAFVPSASDDA